ncbi:nitroreductase family protein [Chryseobacterium koreense]|uniref:Nitroreductase n=1 Tax=Chryseobacterium koreense CCUG 49689 TaxID=1304281 RepID=A0A0J7J2E0_9FLAO|nr:nitroreductase family protein [Chryseobacterium koreense]KMQ72447.1 nitroreductase [Chryseobacterium koreense CCUG 49689]MBB5333462.1 nitroreductase [Chryseobacterium koreense]
MDKPEILKEILKSRKSTFPQNYSPEKIEDAVLSEILESAKYVPSHKKTYPARLKVFRAEEKDRLGNQLAKIYKETTAPENFIAKKYEDIPHKISMADTVIAICINFSGKVPEWEEIASTAAAVENMYLTCAVNEIGCYWSTPGMIRHLGDFLNLEENQKCYGLFYMGKLNREL